MYEQLFLLVFGVAITLIVVFGRRYYNSHRLKPLNKTVEAVARIVLTFGFAFLTQLIFHVRRPGLTYWIGASSTALILYAVTHLADHVGQVIANWRKRP